jgi:hypothetical protein
MKQTIFFDRMRSYIQVDAAVNRKSTVCGPAAQIQVLNASISVKRANGA